MKFAQTYLTKAHLTSMEYASLQEKIHNNLKRQSTSRRSLQKGGPAPRITQLREARAIRDQTEAIAGLKRAQKNLSVAINKEKKLLCQRGVQARKEEKARLYRLQQYQIRGELPPLEDITPIREPDKNPTLEEALLLTEDGHYPLLIQVMEMQVMYDQSQPGYQPQPQQQHPHVNISSIGYHRDENTEIADEDEDEEGSIDIRLEQQPQEREVVLDYIPSSPPRPIHALDMQPSYGSIEGQSDFVSL
jgi:hypothetical protein